MPTIKPKSNTDSATALANIAIEKNEAAIKLIKKAAASKSAVDITAAKRTAITIDNAMTAVAKASIMKTEKATSVAIIITSTVNMTAASTN